MSFAGHSLNLMTLGGLALGAGMLVDNAIVVMESIFRKRADGEPPHVAAATGTGAVAGAIVASTLDALRRVPAGGADRRHGRAARIGHRVHGRLVALVSLAVAVLLIPALAGLALAARRHARRRSGQRAPRSVGLPAPRQAVDRCSAARRSCRWWPCSRCCGSARSCCRRPIRASSACASSRRRDRGSSPRPRRSRSSRRSSRKPRATICEAMLSEVGRLPNDDRLIRELQTEENTARAQAAARRGRPERQHRRATILARGLGSCTAPRSRGRWAAPRSRARSARPARRSSSRSRATRSRSCAQGAELVRARLAERPELWNVQSSFENAPPELRISLKRAVADGLGVDLDTLGAVLETSLDGLRATTVTMGDEERDVVLDVAARPIPRSCCELPVRTSGGQRVAVGDVAEIEEVPGAREIFRRDQRRIAQVTARIAPEVSGSRGSRGRARGARGRRFAARARRRARGRRARARADDVRVALGGGARAGAGLHGARGHVRVAAASGDRARAPFR